MDGEVLPNRPMKLDPRELPPKFDESWLEPVLLENLEVRGEEPEDWWLRKPLVRGGRCEEEVVPRPPLANWFIRPTEERELVLEPFELPYSWDGLV